VNKSARVIPTVDDSGLSTATQGGRSEAADPGSAPLKRTEETAISTFCIVLQ